jgi:ribonuclease Z
VKFEVTILGSSAALPTLQRNSTSHYVTCCNRHILIDCGEGTQMQMRKFGVRFQRLDIILISHLHGDHFFGLVGLLSTMRLLGRNSKLTIICPKGLTEIITKQLEIGYTKLDFDITFIELTGKENTTVYEDNSITIETFPLKHKIPTNGFVIREKAKERKLKKDVFEHPLMKIEYIHLLKKGEDIVTESGETLKYIDFTDNPPPSFSYAYCSDTMYSEKIVDFIKGVTVLYHEATFTGQHSELAKATMHSTAKQAAQIAKQAGVSKLYLGHLSARYSDEKEHEAEARKEFESSFYVNDGMKFLIQ